jgi:hypothetical protein
VSRKEETTGKEREREGEEKKDARGTASNSVQKEVAGGPHSAQRRPKFLLPNLKISVIVDEILS